MAHDYSIIDQINDEYESAIQSGNELRIEDLLERIDQPNRLALFEQLVRTELEYRHKSNEAVGIEEYRKRFPENTDVINSLAARFGDQETVITEGVPGLGRSSWEGASEHLIGPYKLVRHWVWVAWRSLACGADATRSTRSRDKTDSYKLRSEKFCCSL